MPKLTENEIRTMILLVRRELKEDLRPQARERLESIEQKLAACPNHDG